MLPNKVKIVIAGMIIIPLAIYAYKKIDDFFEVDSCLDHGGSWNYQTGKCEFEEEIFGSFFRKFTSDSVFQRERVEFPFAISSWDDYDQLTTEKVERSNWEFATFEYRDEYAKRKIDGYTQETRVYADSVIIELRGIDNGIYIDYQFYKVHGKWYLTSQKDFSN